MKQGGDRKHAQNVSSGFTVVETLIVLSVTSALLISAMAVISGRQNRTEFSTGIQDIQQQLQQLINQTSSGYYPNLGDFSCSSALDADGKVKPKIATGGAAEQGTNGDCVFLGNAFVADPGSNKQIGVHALVGNRLASATGKDAVNFIEAFPIALSTTGDYSIKLKVPNGITYTGGKNATTVSGSTLPLTGASPRIFALASSLGSYDATTLQLNSGSQQIGLYYYCDNIAGVVATIDNAPKSNCAPDPGYGGYLPLKSVSLCFASGGTNQSGLITIGSGQGGLAVSTAVKGNTTCS